jgi:hypothetical protein
MEEPANAKESVADSEWNLESAEIAYRVIASYVEHTNVSGMVIAMLAGALGEERLKAIAQSPYWQSYLASKRAIAEAKVDLERLTRMLEERHETNEKITK